MKVAKIVLAGVLSAAGCANGRPPSSSPATGSGGLSPVPDTTPSLGAPDANSSEGTSFFRGDGPSLKMPEAFRNGLLPGSPRLSSRWQSKSATPRTDRFRPGVSTAPISIAERPVVLDEPSWSRFYRSTDRRVIETIELGKGSKRIAILGSLHGDETQSVALVEELARHFQSHPELLREATVLLVKSPNPDGLAARSPYNVHGVDLNRNFPSANWRALQSSRGGSKSASEAETRVIMRLLTDFRPALVVHLKDSNDKPLVNSEGNARSQAEQIARLLHGQAVEGFGAKTSGSVEDYAATQLKVPSLTLLLAVEASDQAAWAKDRDALLAVVGAGSAKQETGALDDSLHPFDRPAVVKSSLRKPASSPTESERTNTASTRPRTRTRLPDFPAPVPDHGYFELPPP
jgi:hypothetical protein